jgi:hypothetical protein
MRLSNVERGDGFGSRLLFRAIKLFSGFRAPDVIRTVKYHAEIFGAPHGRHTQAVMRGPSDWTVGERELFAAFVSRLNQCLF